MERIFSKQDYIYILFKINRREELKKRYKELTKYVKVLNYF